ncbi:hypothetical protein NDU88_000338 [Pleurodeles waltl]|uniref:Uncharacterized protein n=1 Tax=Pleurodeles waltl TaxID=8319 RepID=A0AAV7U368_PLEWA|nr:hypothetical protein NDU88_000338 [Pleurodeles waltl]
MHRAPILTFTATSVSSHCKSSMPHVCVKENEEQADPLRHVTASRLKLGDLVLVHQRQMRKSDSPSSSQPLKITDIKGSVITAVAGSYSITRYSSHFREFREDEEGETRSRAEQQPPCEDDGEPTRASLPNGEGPLRAEDTSKEKGHGNESSQPMRASRRTKRLIEELRGLTRRTAAESVSCDVSTRGALQELSLPRSTSLDW